MILVGFDVGRRLPPNYARRKRLQEVGSTKIVALVIPCVPCPYRILLVHAFTQIKAKIYFFLVSRNLICAVSIILRQIARLRLGQVRHVCSRLHLVQNLDVVKNASTIVVNINTSEP